MSSETNLMPKLARVNYWREITFWIRSASVAADWARTEVMRADRNSRVAALQMKKSFRAVLFVLGLDAAQPGVAVLLGFCKRFSSAAI